VTAGEAVTMRYVATPVRHAVETGAVGVAGVVAVDAGGAVGAVGAVGDEPPPHEANDRLTTVAPNT